MGVRVCATVVALGLMIAASPRAGIAAARLVIDGPVHDFGAVDRGTPVEHSFTLRNDGDSALRIDGVKGSCGCTTAVTSGSEIPGGGTGTVSVRLDTTALVGRTSKTVTVYTDDAVPAVSTLTVTGQVLSDLVVSPRPLYLGRIRRGGPLRREVVVQPGRPGPAYAVSWLENSNPTVHATLEATAEPGRQRIVVELDREIPLGRLNDELVLHTTSPRDAVLTVPVFGSVEGDVVVLPPQVTFGVSRGGDVPPRELYIRNRGSRPVAVTRVAVPEKVVSYDLKTVKEGLEYRLTLWLRHPLPVGKVEGSVDIYTDHPDETHLVVPLYAIVRDGGARS